MIATITGTLTHKSPEFIIVETGGIGYQIFTPLSSFYSLPEIGGKVNLQTYTYVREDILSLYGFSTSLEKEMFLLLINISGIGPRLANNILSGISVNELVTSIANSDKIRLSAIPGIGKKTAERLILELKEKVPVLKSDDKDKIFKNKISDDLLSALVNLGYNKNLAKEIGESVYKEMSEKSSVEEMIKESLKRLLK